MSLNRIVEGAVRNAIARFCEKYPGAKGGFEKVVLHLPNRLDIEAPHLIIPGVMEFEAELVTGEVDIVTGQVRKLFLLKPSVSLEGVLESRQKSTGGKKLPQLIAIRSGTVQIGQKLTRHIPVSICEVTGTVTPAPESPSGLTFSLTGVLQPLGRLSASGKMDTASGVLDCSLRFGDIELNERVLELLPEGARKSIEQLQPSGRTRIGVDFTGSFKNFRVTVEPLGMSVKPKPFPLPVEGLSGRLVYDGQTLNVENITGFSPIGPISAFGRVGKDEKLLVIRGDDLAIGSQLRSYAPEEVKKILDLAGLSAGKADVVFRVFGTKGKSWSNLTATLEGVDVIYRDMPLPVSGISGEVEWNGRKVIFRDLRGRVAGGSLSLRGSFSLQNEYNLDVEVSNITVDEGLLKKLPTSVSSVLGEYEISGRVSSSLKLRGTKEKQTIVMRSALRGMGGVFRGLRLSELAGEVTLSDDELTFKDVLASALGGRLRIEGSLTLSEKPIVSLFVEGWQVKISDELHKLLPAQVVDMLKKFQFRARTSFTLRLEGRVPKLESSGVVSIINGRGSYQSIIFEGVQGEIQLGEQVSFELGGIVHGARFKLRGSYSLADGAVSLLCDVWGMELDEKLVKVLPQSISEIIKQYEARTRLNLSLSIAGKPGSPDTFQTSGRIEFVEARAKFRDLDIANTRGAVQLSNDTVVLSSFRGTLEGAPFLLNGTISKESLELIAEFRKLYISNRILDLLPESIQPVLNKFTIGGVINGSVYFKRGEETQMLIDIELVDCGARTSIVAMPFNDIRGRIGFDGETLRIEQLRFESKKAKFTTSGTITNERASLDLKVENLRDNLLTRLTPPVVAQELVTMGFKTSTDLQSHIKLKFDHALTASHSTEVRLRDSQLLFGLRIDQMAGTASIRGKWSGSLLRQRGNFALSEFVVMGKEITDLTGSFDYQPGKRLSFAAVKGIMYGGRLSGKLQIELGSPIAYSGEFFVRGLDIGELAERFGASEKGIHGWLNISIRKIKGGGPKTSDINASNCYLTITNGELMKLPLIYTAILTLGSFKAKKITDATAEFDVEHGIVKFKKLAFEGPELVIIGEGSVDLSGTLDLTFAISRIGTGGIINATLDILRTNLAGVHLTGKFSKPKAVPVPIPRIEKRLKALLGGIKDLIRKKKKTQQ